MSSNLDKNLYHWLPNENILQVFDWQEVFKNNHPVEVDLGAGDGGFVLELAKRHPNVNYIAIERLLGRIKKIVKRSAKENCNNIRALRLESFYFLKWMCPLDSLNRIHIMFPDPWPKRKHFKHRLIQPEFVEVAHKALKPHGVVRFATDHEDYFKWVRKVWAQAVAAGRWKDLGEWDFSQDLPTDFQKTFDQEGRKTYRTSWQAI